MATVHLVFAKHSDERLPTKVRGAEYRSRILKDILSKRSRKFALLLEDNFTGQDLAYMRPDISHYPQLRQRLAEETRHYRSLVADLCRSVDCGEDDAKGILRAFEVIETVISLNKQCPGTVTVHFSDADSESQLLTIESFYWKNEGYLLAFTRGDLDSAVEALVKSVHLMVSAVRIRDRLLIRQATALADSADVIVLQGSNHCNLAGMEWPGVDLEVHSQPDDQFPYYDEMLIALLAGKVRDERELKDGMLKEIRFHSIFYPMVLNSPSAYVEDLLACCRSMVERQ